MYIMVYDHSQPMIKKLASPHVSKEAQLSQVVYSINTNSNKFNYDYDDRYYEFNFLFKKRFPYQIVT